MAFSYSFTMGSFSFVVLRVLHAFWHFLCGVRALILPFAFHTSSFYQQLRSHNHGSFVGISITACFLFVLYSGMVFANTVFDSFKQPLDSVAFHGSLRCGSSFFALPAFHGGGFDYRQRRMVRCGVYHSNQAGSFSANN